MFSPSPIVGTPPCAIDRPERVAALLRALGIAEVSFSLDGSGDSGDTSFDGVLYADGRHLMELPDLPIGFGSDGRVLGLFGYLDDFAANLPDGDWVNNEGGYGTVTIRPFADDDHERFECDMTYREEGDYGDDDDDESFDDIELDDIGNALTSAVTCITVVEPAR